MNIGVSITIGHVIPGPLLGNQLFQTIAETRLNYDQCSCIIIPWSLFLLLFCPLQRIIDCVLNFDFLPKTVQIPWRCSDWKTFSEFPWLFQFSLTWMNPEVKVKFKVMHKSACHGIMSSLNVIQYCCSIDDFKTKKLLLQWRTWTVKRNYKSVLCKVIFPAPGLKRGNLWYP